MQFEGRTAEEAVARARAALGSSGDLRCWKTRRGGVAGFFATEVFVASLTPPPGSEAGGTARARALPRRSRVRDGSAVAGPGPAAAGADRRGPEPAGGGTDQPDGASWDRPVTGHSGPADLLSGLVEATSDEVTLRSVSIPPGAFDDVLAEAEAALARHPDHPEDGGAGGGAPPVTPTPASPAAPDASVAPAIPPREAGMTETPTETASETASKTATRPGVRSTAPRRAKRATRPKADADGRPAPAPRSRRVPADQRWGAGPIPDLRAALLDLGLPAAYLPRGQRPSLDALVRAMGRLTAPPPLPSGEGTVVAVVGSRPHLDRTIDLVAAELSLGARDVLWLEDGSGLGRQVARRRAGGRTALVAVDGGPGTPSGASCALLGQAAPDYVLGAVGAPCKRVDVEHWAGGLVRVDALALWDLAGTRTPAELLGTLPIAFVDGEPSSPLGWTLLLAGRAQESPR
jgi:hypothetical protein